MSKLRGIETWQTADGPRYRVRVRRRGQEFSGNFAKLTDAIIFRDKARGAAVGLNEPPAPKALLAPLPPERAKTVEDGARRLCRQMVAGSARTNSGAIYKPSVCRRYESSLRLIVVPELGDVPIASLSQGDVQRWVDSVAVRRTSETARKGLTSLRVVCRLAQRYDEITTNPCAGVRVPTDPAGETPPRVLTPEEAERIIAQATADDLRLGRSFGAPLIALALGSGLRLGELLALQWGSDGLDLASSVVRVRRSLDRVRGADGAYAELAPKSRASRRDVPLPPEDVSRLRLHRMATGRPPEGELVFGRPDGEALSPVPAYRAFKRAAKRAGIAEPLPRFHDCRHAFASHALAAGLTAHVVAVLLGHTDAGLVSRRYGHALPDEVARAGEALSAWRAARSG